MVLVLHLNTLCDHSSFHVMFFFLTLGFALHYIHAVHDRFKKKKGKKGCVLYYISWICNQSWPIIFT